MQLCTLKYNYTLCMSVDHVIMFKAKAFRVQICTTRVLQDYTVVYEGFAILLQRIKSVSCYTPIIALGGV